MHGYTANKDDYLKRLRRMFRTGCATSPNPSV